MPSDDGRLAGLLWTTPPAALRPAEGWRRLCSRAVQPPSPRAGPISPSARTPPKCVLARLAGKDRQVKICRSGGHAGRPTARSIAQRAPEPPGGDTGQPGMGGSGRRVPRSLRRTGGPGRKRTTATTASESRARAVRRRWRPARQEHLTALAVQRRAASGSSVPCPPRVGDLAGRGRPPPAAARRAGLEVVEKALTARRELDNSAVVSGPPECPGNTTRTGCTPWRRGSWARPSNGPETYKGCNHLSRPPAKSHLRACGYPLEASRP
jgi:hypothetical protein